MIRSARHTTPKALPSVSWRSHRQAREALSRVDHTLVQLPDDMAALFDRACLLDRLGRIDAARQAYLHVLARDLRHAGALANLGTLLAAGGYTSAALTTFAQAVAAHPADPDARVNLANLLRQAGRTDDARTEYDAALRLAPAHPEAHQGLSYLLDETDPEAAAAHRISGFTGRALTTAPYRGKDPPVRVLQLVAARGGNIPTRPILDDQQFLTHTLVADFADPDQPWPPHDVVFNTIGDADLAAPALQEAERLLARSAAPILNPPSRILPTARAANTARLGALPGVIAPRTVLLPKSSLAAGPPGGFAFPFLLRSPGFHTGQHFHRVDDRAALAAALAALPGEKVMALDYLDASGPDGYVRKYRVLFIGGVLFPLHLAISTDWKVHYFTAAMTDHAAHRAEEARFLQDMPGTLGPTAMAALVAIQAELGLDYAGIDFALAPDGRLLLFEANATMTIVLPAADPIWDYRRPAIARALRAAQQLIRRTASQPVRIG